MYIFCVLYSEAFLLVPTRRLCECRRRGNS